MTELERLEEIRRRFSSGDVVWFLKQMEELHGKVEKLRAAVLAVVPECFAVVKEDKQVYFCGVPADWLAEWSDREMYVCEAHKGEAQRNYDGDHEYDRTGLRWVPIPSGRIAREALGEVEQ